MHHIIASILFSFIATGLVGQNFNIDLQGKVQYDVESSDIWGYVDEQGNEYALVGLYNDVSIVNVTDPQSPIEVFRTEGEASSVWRDIKTWGEYAYVTCECGPGLMIIDLSPLPESNNLNYSYWIGDTAIFYQAHNLFIDDHGIAYIFGSDFSAGGAIMLDLKIDPMNPITLGIYDDNYLHDGVVRNDTLYGSAVFDGELQVVDVQNKRNPKKVASWKTPGVFTHNAWVSSNGKYVFTTDEVKNGRIAAYDASNIFNPIELDNWIVNDTSIIPHNTHWKDSFLITSYYTYGINIIDVSRPHNMVEVGHFDTSPDYRYEGFSGCWGVYPWLPSGNIIASDMEEGLYVFKPNYRRACYLEGQVTDQQTGRGIFYPQVEILGWDTAETGNIKGEYALGTLNSGLVDVVYSAESYYPDTVRGVSLENGVITKVNAQLSKWPTGLSELHTRDEFILFPNPTSGNFSVQCRTGMDDFAIYSMDGKTVYHGRLFAGLNEFQIAEPGIYYLVGVSNEAVVRKEILVQ